jgi:hypothetical protein
VANNEKFQLAHVEAPLRATGVVTAAAKTLQQAYGPCTPTSVRNYINRHPSLKRVVAEVVEQNPDLAEHKLLAAINHDNMTAIIFYLKSKGREIRQGTLAACPPDHGENLPDPTTDSLIDAEIWIPTEAARPH